MPGMGRSAYYWKRYEEQRKLGKTKTVAAEIASIIEDRHKAKLKRNRRARR